MNIHLSLAAVLAISTVRDEGLRMPRACPGEVHVSCYGERQSQ